MYTTPSSLGRSMMLAAGLAVSLLLVPSAASAASAASANEAPAPLTLTSFTITSTQCAGPTYLPAAYPVLGEIDSELGALTGAAPGTGPYPPTFSSCTPLPAAAAPVVGSASISSVATPDGTATVSVGAQGNQVVEESANVSTTLSASITLSSAAPSVTFTIPYSTSGLTQSGPDDPFTLVSFTAANALVHCVDGSDGFWSNPPGEYDLGSPMGPGAGSASVQVFCPDGSELAPGAVGMAVNLLANASSSDGQSDAASANISLQDVTATIDD